MMMGRELSGRVFKNLGQSEQHHIITHHRHDKKLIEQKAADRRLPLARCRSTCWSRRDDESGQDAFYRPIVASRVDVAAAMAASLLKARQAGSCVITLLAA